MTPIRRLLPLACALIPALLAPSLAAQDPDAPRRGRRPEARDVDSDQPAAGRGASVEESMKGVNRHFRMVSRFLRKPEGEAPMDSVLALQKLAMDSKLGVPAKAATLPEDERAAFVAAYRRDMTQFLRATLDLEEAMLAEEWEKAAEIAKGLNAAKKTGHKAYKGDDRDGDGDADGGKRGR